ncbi:putative oxygenase MesX, partial [Enterobacter hormaechei]|uniref:putative oxygenase MesX n=1 Tax=Enterobacter hormaechei TaxID=158836 RepID=UPI003CC6C108
MVCSLRALIHSNTGPSLNNQDHSLTKIVYDREERSQLAIEQGKFTEEQFIK